MAAVASLTAQPITVLLVDDQPIVGAAVKRMLEGEADIRFHHCQDPTKAIATAKEVGPTVILQDLVMPEVDGLTLVKFYRANAATRDVPVVVLSTKEEPQTKAEAFALGANDYLVKLPDKLEVVARIRYHSQAYINYLERLEAYRRLEESRRQLAEEVAQAARYVVSLLPTKLAGKVRTDWRFIPSTQLGGDSFGYHWLDDDHFVVYLLDVCGHGVGAALLAVSVMNVLRAQSLPNADFREPGQVLAHLNQAFPMEKQGDKYFTMWYGVYQPSGNRLRFAGAGHPPPLLFTGATEAEGKWEPLKARSMAVGMMEDTVFPTREVQLGAFTRLYLYSDGVYEIAQEKAGGGMWPFEEFVSYLTSRNRADGSPMDQLYQHVRQLYGSDTLADDFSMVEVNLGAAAG